MKSFFAACFVVIVIIFIAFEIGLFPSKYKPSFSNEVRAIEKVLELDDKTTENLPDNPRQAYQTVVSRMRAIDTSDCPGDFRMAYERHIHAWEGMRDQVLSEPDGVLESLFVGFINGLSGDFTGGLADMGKAEQYWNQQIKDTFNEVRAVALKYGAKTN